MVLGCSFFHETSSSKIPSIEKANEEGEEEEEMRRRRIEGGLDQIDKIAGGWLRRFLR
jgi:hypothetical protein